jgi:hypothetical protein
MYPALSQLTGRPFLTADQGLLRKPAAGHETALQVIGVMDFAA